MNTTDAWVLSQGQRRPDDSDGLAPAQLELRKIPCPEPQDHEVLVEPIFGCWEANMTHALQRVPVDVCRLRMEDFVVLGNAGMVRVLKPGRAVSSFAEGDLCLLVPIGKQDEHGNLVTVVGYDAHGTHGLLAKRINLLPRQLLKLEDDGISLHKWAAFSLRYSTAWVNWQVSFGTYRLIASAEQVPEPWVVGWGGGVSFAQLQLARHFGCKVALIASGEERHAAAARAGMVPIDRADFDGLDFDESRYNSDRAYKSRYLKAEARFIRAVREVTGDGAAIFIDNIGRPVFRATLKALTSQAVITTCGWKFGQDISYRRAAACMRRHQLVHTHGASYAQGEAAVNFAREHAWLPEEPERIFGWDEVPALAEAYAAGRVSSYFPLYKINPL